MRGIAGAAILAAALAMTTGAAQAAYVNIGYGPGTVFVNFLGQGAEVNTVTMTPVDVGAGASPRANILMRDATARRLDAPVNALGLTPFSSGTCAGPGVGAAICTGGTVASPPFIAGDPLGTSISTRDGNDVVDISALPPLPFLAYSNNDRIILGGGNDLAIGNGSGYVSCGPGIDTVRNVAVVSADCEIVG